jgi:polar amino acid transport system substrate-binding protein
MKKTILFSVLSILFISHFSYSEDFVIAGIPEKPNRWRDSAGNYQGLDVDIVNYIMKKMGITYVIILEKSSPRLTKNWKSKETDYDMVFTYSKKPEREKYLYYAHESHISFSWNLFYLNKNKGKYKFDNYDDLKGLRIGVTKGLAYTPEFLEIANSGLFKKDNVVKNQLQIKKLLSDRIDLVPLNTVVALYNSKLNGYRNKISYLEKPIKSKPYFNAFVKASNYPNIDKIRKEYDVILKEMKENGTLDQILAKYGIIK